MFAVQSISCTSSWRRRGKLSKNAKDIRLSVAHGVNADGNAQIIPLTDVSNMTMVRDGTALTPREGLEIRKHYNLNSGYGSGEMVILKESAPPDVSLGNMFLTIDPSQGQLTVVDIEFMRDRTQLEGDNLLATARWYIGESNPEAPAIDALDFVAVGVPQDLEIGRAIRSGNLGFTSYLQVYTVDGDAIAGVNYTAINGTQLNMVEGVSQSAIVTVRDIVAVGAEPRFFYVDLVRRDIDTNTLLGPPTRITVTISGL